MTEFKVRFLSLHCLPVFAPFHPPMNTFHRLTATDLNALRKQEPELVIMDVRLSDDYEQRAIEGAVNNCVYEVAFQSRLTDLVPDLQTPVCLYGESQDSHEATMAAQKLLRAGYARVFTLQGCLAAWTAAGLPLQGNGNQPEIQPLPVGHLPIDVTESRVEWLGRNLLNKHWGHLPILSGYLDIRDGELAGGEVILGMTDITCDDLAGNPYHDVLIAHLRSDDFFDTEIHPEARLKILQAKLAPKAAPGTQNLQINAELTLKGITAPIQFTAAAGLAENGRYAAQAAFSIDRTRWGVLYGSGQFFHRLAGHLVNDLIEIQVRIVTQSA